MQWATVVVAVLGVGTAIGLFWRVFLLPLLRAASAAQSATPTLLQIAGDFRNGHSLKQRIDQVADHLERQDERLGRIEAKLDAMRVAPAVP